MDNHPAINPSDRNLQAVLNVVREWAKAVVSNDAEQIGSFMDDEWVIVSKTGVSSKQQFLSFVESGDLTHDAFDIVGEPRVRTYGEIALVTARVTNTAHYRGERFDADEWTTGVFVKREDRWLCVLSQITPVETS